jgi:hypothetical protein
MKYRKLRIAWSVASGILCLLLIALWVRSYWWQDSLYGRASAARWLFVSSDLGTITIGVPSDTQWSGVPISRSWTRDTFYKEHEFEEYGHRGEPKYLRGFQLLADWTSVLLPDWFLVLFTAALASVPWLRFRFSLRTLLIGMTVVAAVLGLLVWAMNRPRHI